MVIFHAFLALAAGFLSMAVLVGLATAALMKFVPEWATKPGQANNWPTTGYVFVNLGYSFVAAMVGGFVTTLVAQGNPLIHALALALIVLLLSALSAIQMRGMQPVWYQLTLTALAPIGVIVGSLVRLRMQGLL